MYIIFYYFYMIILPLYITVHVLCILYILLLLVLLWTLVLYEAAYISLLIEYVYSMVSCIILFVCDEPTGGWLLDRKTYVFLSCF